MYIKTILLSFALILSNMALADKGDFEFSVNGKSILFVPESIKSISYIKSKTDYEQNHLALNFTDKGAENLFSLTRENIGKLMEISYKGNVISIANIVQPLRSGMKIPVYNTPTIVLKQIIDDYSAREE